MLTPVERLLFLALAPAGRRRHLYANLREVYQIVMRGAGELALDNLPRRALKALGVYVTQRTTLRTRRLTSLFHLGAAWGLPFIFW